MGQVIRKQGQLRDSAYAVRMFSLAFRAPAGFELAEREQLTAVQNGFWKWEMSRGWSLEI